MSGATTRERIGDAIPIEGGLPRLGGIVLFFVGWWIIASIFPKELVPYPEQAVVLAWELVSEGAVTTHLIDTLVRTFLGFFGGFLLGTMMGVMMGIDDYQRRFMTPHVILSLSIPHISWAVIATMIFGFNILAPVVASVLVVFPFVAVNVWKGVENIDTDLIEMSQSFNASFFRTLHRVIIPNMAPQMFSGSRLGMAMAWKTVVITEMFASQTGMGHQLVSAYEVLEFDRAWAWALIFMVVILIIEYGVFKPLQRKVFEYQQDADFTIL